MAASPDTLDLSLLAREYVKAGFALVPIESGKKGPRSNDWNRFKNCVTTIEQCGRIKANVGLAHVYSRTCVLDFDDLARATEWLASHSIVLADLWDAPDAVRISSGRPNRGKLLFRLPEGARPPRTFNRHDDGIELRCASAAGATVQDVLPPSIHPDTGRPYEWEFGVLGHWNNPPMLPADVMALWRSLEAPAEKTSKSDKAPLGLGRKELRKLLAQLDPNCGHDEWRDVGFALHHETRGADLGLELWDEWSEAGDTYPGYETLAKRWESFGHYPGVEVTARTLLTRAGVTCAEDDFEVLDDLPEPEQVQEARAARFTVMNAGEFASGPPQPWIIKGVLPKAQVGMIFGESTAGKSFVVIDMLGAIARGVDWRGLRTRPGRVVLVVAEGVGGAMARMKAYGQHHGVDISAIPFGIIKDTPNLAKDDHKGLAKQVMLWGGADVIVLDTLAQSAAGANENSGEDMGKVLKRCRELHEETGAMVLLVHHAGKDATRGARGWSGLKAAMDVELEVTRALGQRSVKISKSKDGVDGAEMGFRLNIVEIGVDEDGDPITSCVIEHMAEIMVSGDSKDGLKEADRIVLRTMTDAINTGLVDSMWSEDLKRTAAERLHVKGKVDNRRRDAGNSIAKLVKLGYFSEDAKNYISLVDRSDT